MVHWFSPLRPGGFVAGALLGPFGFAGVLAPLLGFPPQCLGGARPALSPPRRRRVTGRRARPCPCRRTVVPAQITWTTAARFPLPLVSASAVARNDAAPMAQTSPASSARAAQRVAERGRMVAREPGAARLDGVGDGDLDDPRHPADGELGGLVPESPHPVLRVEQLTVVVVADRAEPPRRGGLGVSQHRVVQRGDHVVAPVQPGQVGDTGGGGADRLLLWRCPSAPSNSRMNSPSGTSAPVRSVCRMWLYTSAVNAARSYQCGDDGDDGVHFDHA